jgi:Tol biopolymer transport system component
MLKEGRKTLLIGLVLFALIICVLVWGVARMQARTGRPPGYIVAVPTVTPTDTPEVEIGPTPTPGPTGGDAAPASIQKPVFSPKPSSYGDKIAFTSQRDGRRQVYLLSSDGSGLTHLVDSKNDDQAVGWVRAGLLAFISIEQGQAQKLYTVDPNSKEVVRLTGLLDDGQEFAWSGDGRYVAITRGIAGAVDIYLLETSGVGGFNLTRDTEPNRSASWAPDSRRLAFASWRDYGSTAEIYLVNRDGSDLKRLTYSGTEDDVTPAWSPDGTTIALAISKEGAPTDIYTMDVDGAHLRQLTTDPADDRAPSWSPDGKRIAFQSRRDGNWEIYVMNSDGSEQTRLTNSPADDVGPFWSP